MALRADQIEDDEERKQDIALCIILSITAIEAFVNVYFRVVVSEPGFEQHLRRVQSDLKGQSSLPGKLEMWPRLIFGMKFDFMTEPGKSFDSLRKHRNDLIHFKSTHQTISFPGVSIHGLADISAFDALLPSDADNAVHVAEAVIAKLFKLRGIPAEQVPHMVHGWTGKLSIPGAVTMS